MRRPYGRARAGAPPAHERLIHSFPASIGLTARGAVGSFHPPSDNDSRSVLAAIASVISLVGLQRGRLVLSSVIRVLPFDRLPGWCPFEHLTDAILIGFVHSAAHIASDDGAEDRAADSRHRFSASLAELRSQQASGSSAKQRADDGTIAASQTAGRHRYKFRGSDVTLLTVVAVFVPFCLLGTITVRLGPWRGAFAMVMLVASVPLLLAMLAGLAFHFFFVLVFLALRLSMLLGALVLPLMPFFPAVLFVGQLKRGRIAFDDLAGCKRRGMGGERAHENDRCDE